MNNTWKLKKQFKNLKGNIYTVLIARLLLVMLLFTICRILFYLFNTSFFSGITAGGLLKLFAGGLKFDITSTLYINILYILMLLIPFRFRYNASYQGFLKWLFYITNSIALATNCIDIIYFGFTQRRTTWSVFKEFSHDTGNARLAGTFFMDYWYIIVIYIILIIILVRGYRLVKLKSTTINNNWVYYPIGSVLMVFFAGLCVAGFRGGFRHSTRPITLSNASDYVEKPIEANIVLNTPFAMIKTFNGHVFQKVHFFKTEAELDSVFSPLHYPKTSAPFRADNVVIIILESHNKEYLGFFNKDLDGGTYKGYTPFTDSLLQHSLSFKYSYANGTKSIDAMPSVLASIPSMGEPYVTTPYSNNDINSLAGILGKKGYTTSFFHGAPNGSMGFSAFAKVAGFQNYFGKTEYNNDDDFDGMWGIWDEPFFQFMAHTLSAQKQPFFATVFSVSSHHPFKVPERYTGKFPKGPLPVHECIGYTDNALRQFFETAKKEPWFKNTLFVFTADHSSFRTHPKYETSIGAYAIPIFFYKPGSDLKGCKDELMQQIDIMPTVLGYLNYDQPYVAFGQDVINTNSNEKFLINYPGQYQLLMGDYLMLHNGIKPTSLYNYKNDELQKKNLVGTLPAIEQQMDSKIKAFIQQYNNRLIDNKLIVAK
ncbi:LTA synthase family protein [Solitalea koreensis]|uniref:Phosphoglycerol transferase MdoB n=1 Tax=Solitalea koreensis TaxID=543615 RepID=A0A521ECG4_9SPHI|nr:LTA synthase family protein [Solitalea koreensis]SMO81161.1 Phosphoglycerol transferase MdoB [Solitalea koreensis]